MLIKKPDHLVNHIVLALDASSSMIRHTDTLIKVADGLVADLAQTTQQNKQETRITIYTFADTAECLVYDMDVTRLPSIATLYRADGWTALLDATGLALDDLKLTPTKYGDHAFLLYVLTDGEENRSRTYSPFTLSARMMALPDNWTMAALVPDARGVMQAKNLGFPAGSIAIWDVTTRDGLVEVGEKLRESTQSYMNMRATGTRGTKSLFTMGADAVNKVTVAAAGLAALPVSSYLFIPVNTDKIEIRDFVEQCGFRYRTGDAYYPLTKPSIIQANKDVMIVHKATNRVYAGPQARALLNLPDEKVTVKPEHNPDYTIYVQSTSLNRHLVIGTHLLLKR